MPDNVWLRSSDPAVESHRLEDFEVPSSKGGRVQPIVYEERRWVFSRTMFERDKSGAETRWLLFLDQGPAEQVREAG